MSSFPTTPHGPMRWQKNELQAIDYIFQLNNLEIEEIKTAVLYFKLSGLPRSSINKKTFPLAAPLATRLSKISNDLYQGRGVSVLRGIEAADFNDEEAVIAFAGITSYICALRATDPYANQGLSHVRDAAFDTKPVWLKGIGLAGSKTRSPMEFHCDRFSGDILALHVRNDGGANCGGEQYVCSFWRIYEELLQTEPLVLETMTTPNWPFELKDKDDTVYLEFGPILFFSKGRPICQLVRAPLLGSPYIPRDTSMPSLSLEQSHALNVIEALAKRFCTKIDRQTGDIQLINNMAILHARSKYGIKGQRSKRHLLRMFLRDPDNAWETPNEFKAKFDDPFTPGRFQELPVIDLDPWRKTSGRDSHG